MFTTPKKTVLATAAVAVALVNLSAPAFANTWVNPKWPTVKCKKDGKRFPYQLNGAPSYASAAEKCAAHGGVDSDPPIVRGKPVVVKESVRAIGQIPTKPGCGSPSGDQNQNTC